MIYFLDHVQTAIPVGGEDAARAFYGALLGLPEIAKPPALAVHGGCWFILGDRQLHMGAEQAFIPAKKAHVGVCTDDLAGLQARLDAAGHWTKADTRIDGVARFFTDDPFGNRIEFIEAKARE